MLHVPREWLGIGIPDRAQRREEPARAAESDTRDHGRLLPFRNGLRAAVTIHPSAILRSITDAQRHTAMAEFVDDLRAVAEVLEA